MRVDLEGKVAAVAAASSGLGYASALALARAGARVAICSSNPERLGSATEELRRTLAKEAPTRSPEDVLGVTADLSTPGGPGEFLKAATSELGAPDVLVVNNGGPPPGGPLDFDDRAWCDAFSLTFLSATRLVRGVAGGMRKKGWGRIVFITSTSVKQPIGDLALSTAIRSAVIGYAKTLADELAPSGITVNSLGPGAILTPRLDSLLERRAAEREADAEAERDALRATIPLRRFGTPEEFGAAVAFLASDQAGYITGTWLPVDGGQLRAVL